jgi:hypothetical protein
LIFAGGAKAELLGLCGESLDRFRSRSDARPGLHQFILEVGGLDVDRARTFWSASDPQDRSGQ